MDLREELKKEFELNDIEFVDNKTGGYIDDEFNRIFECIEKVVKNNVVKSNVMNWVAVSDVMPKITTNTMSDWVLTFSKNECRIDKAFYSKVTGWQAEHGEPMNVDFWKPLPKPPCL